jgi:glycosyltransferase involved in cell wall biosynthesis
MRHTWRGANLSLPRQILFPLAVLFNTSGNLKDFDVYHGHIYSSGIVAKYLAYRHSKVAVNTIHGSYYPLWHELTDPFTATFYRTAEHILAPLLAKMSHLQVHTGDYFARQVLAWGAPVEKVVTIHNGVDITAFNPGATGLISTEDMQHIQDISVPVILTARRLVKKNGVDYLIRAIGHVLKKERCRLIIVGDGDELPYLERLACDLNIEKHVHFTGFIRHEELASYLALADIAVVPSLIEASSLFMLEAMAMEKAVIATNTGGLPEVLDPSAGMLVEPRDEEGLANAILELLRDKEKRGRLGRNARLQAEKKHSWEAVTQRIEAEYQRLLEDRRIGKT